MTTPFEYAEDLQRATAEALGFAESCSPEEWATVVPGDDWPVCVVVHHLALGCNLVTGWIDCALEGRPIADTGEGIDEENHRHAEEFREVSVAETVELLRANGAAAVAKLGHLAESDLTKSAEFGPAGGEPFSVEQFCTAATGHIRSHIGRARDTLGRDDD